MYAIETKIRPVTATKPLRIKVSTGINGKSRTYSEPVESHDSVNLHVWAIKRFLADEIAAGCGCFSGIQFVGGWVDTETMIFVEWAQSYSVVVGVKP